MTAIMDVRNRRKDAFKERNGISLGFMSFFTKAAVGALKAFPRLNAEIQGNEFVLKHYYDIGIAVGAEEGLVVPVLHEADSKSVAQIEREISELAKKARANTLSLSELQGGTFTITNGGIFGSLVSTPILNFPQVGILGMNKIQDRPVAVDGKALRGIHGEQVPGVHLVSVYSVGAGAVLAQLAAPGTPWVQGQELAATHGALARAPLRGRVVVGDALQTQRAVCAQIVESGGDYLLPVKDNQPALRAELAAAFSPPGGAPRRPRA